MADDWAERHREAVGVPDDDDWVTELYSADESCVIGQQLFDGGLIFLVNQSVLHHYGFALGATVDDGRVTGLSLHRTSDEDGVCFDEVDIVKGRRKMRAAEYLPSKTP